MLDCLEIQEFKKKKMIKIKRYDQPIILSELEKSKIKSDTYLDIGCNDCSFTLEIAKIIKAKKVYGMDVNPKETKGVITIKSSFEDKLPFKDNQFNFISIIQTIEHIRKIDEFIDEIKRILKPNGYFLIVTPNLASWHNIIFLILGQQPKTVFISNKWYVGNKFYKTAIRKVYKQEAIGHLRAFTYYSLKRFIELNGFYTERNIGCGWLGLPSFMGKIDRTHCSHIILLAKVVK